MSSTYNLFYLVTQIIPSLLLILLINISLRIADLIRMELLQNQQKVFKFVPTPLR